MSPRGLALRESQISPPEQLSRPLERPFSARLYSTDKEPRRIALESDQSPSLAQIGSLPGSRGSVPRSGGPAGPGSGGAFPPERQRRRPLRAVRSHAFGRALCAGGRHRRSGSAGHIHADCKGVRSLPLLVPPVIHTSSPRRPLGISSLDSSRFAASFSGPCSADSGAQPLVQNRTPCKWQTTPEPANRKKTGFIAL